MATWSVARIFTNSIFSAAKICFEIFGGARHSPNKFGSALACAKIREISATDQVAINIIEHVSCKFVKFVGKKSEIRGP